MKGNWLKVIRSVSGMTQQELEIKSGVSVRTITRIENGEIPRLSTLKQLGKVLENECGDICILKEMRDGHELLNTLCGRHQMAFNHADFKQNEQNELIESVHSYVQEVDMVWEEVDNQSRFKWGEDMSRMMEESEKLGIVWFGMAYAASDNQSWETGYLYAVELDDESITRK
ncbi:hypothetical protein EXIGUO8H_320003 [Exiguobacterium sp. 8H]|uniref:helix-turn-helix domain-containing protein n=1 Tax=unclassified Exiguobacterium TaxID=2644629 RepID=UPI0012F368B8|nr:MULTISPECIES: helix-turn-helix transcriptional regulator [unclassified Exiguobacterium]VXB82518.1 hypothetical protein EXIGUO8H_320003 [Exiguobacterium sp. 8H]VXC04722.1 hypothetical protein EXIGUO8A_730003 [Exiguobacterium sp. 8A]